MTRLADLDTAKRPDAVSVARHHEARKRPVGRPMGLDRLRHGGGGLAGSDHHGAAGRRHRQVPGYAKLRRRGIDGGLEQAEQQLAFRSRHGGSLPVRRVSAVHMGFDDPSRCVLPMAWHPSRSST